MKAKLPAVLTITEEANKPRKFTLDGMLKAKKTKIELWDKNAIGADPELLGLKGSPTIVKKVFPPPGRKQGETFDGTQDPHAAAKWLIQKLIAVNALGASQPKPTQPAVHVADQGTRIWPVRIWESSEKSGSGSSTFMADLLKFLGSFSGKENDSQRSMEPN